jgi:peptidyl-prolyl cis-trans isomerase SurA
VLTTLAQLGLLILSQSGGGERSLVDRIVAVVNEEVITLSELETAEKPFMAINPTADKKKKLRRDMLDQLISERLLSEQVKEAKLKVTQEEVERAIDDIVRQNSISREQLQQAVEARGMSMSQYRHDLEKQLVRLKLVDLKVRAKVVVPESDIRAEYDKMKANAPKEELISIRHVFFRWGESPDPAEKTRVMESAKKARKRVAGGEDFAKVAKEISQGPTASTGGELGQMSVKSLLPELARGLKDLKDGEISAPIETANGVHVVRVEGREQKPPKTYAEVKTQIYQGLYQKEVERQMKLWVTELRGQAAIDVRL